MKGYIEIYHGNGKGKTTASVGLAVRCSAYDKKVVFTQFLKGSNSGELGQLAKLGITIMRNSRNYGFFPMASKNEQDQITRENNDNLRKSIELARNNMCDLLILDEVLDAYNIGALDKNILDEFICNKPQNVELVLTGRNPTQLMREKADYITYFDKEKHPYDKGLQARESIEY